MFRWPGALVPAAFTRRGAKAGGLQSQATRFGTISTFPGPYYQTTNLGKQKHTCFGIVSVHLAKLIIVKKTNFESWAFPVVVPPDIYLHKSQTKKTMIEYCWGHFVSAHAKYDVCQIQLGRYWARLNLARTNKNTKHLKQTSEHPSEIVFQQSHIYMDAFNMKHNYHTWAFRKCMFP